MKTAQGLEYAAALSAIIMLLNKATKTPKPRGGNKKKGKGKGKREMI